MPPDPIPYGRQSLDAGDRQAVAEALASGWLTTGPRVQAFEQALAAHCGVAHAVAVSSGTAALHLALAAAGIGPGDEVVVPATTFVATANAVLYCGATPVFADVDPQTLLLDPESAATAVNSRTRAIVAVDYAGQPCDYDALAELTSAHDLRLFADACHSLGASFRGRSVGTLAEASLLSFHPVKPITTGEGGAMVTDDGALAERCRRLRNHGLDLDAAQRSAAVRHDYDMVELGWNYRLTDIQCALGLSQLRRLPAFVRRRQALADRYDRALADLPGLRPLSRRGDRTHARHLYVVRVRGDRDAWFRALRARGIGVNVHYRPVYLHSYYRRRFGHRPGLCPNAERAYGEILSLPLFPDLTEAQMQRVVDALRAVADGLAGGA
jgi:perosamine synthetase